MASSSSHLPALLRIRDDCAAAVPTLEAAVQAATDVWQKAVADREEAHENATAKQPAREGVDDAKGKITAALLAAQANNFHALAEELQRCLDGFAHGDVAADLLHSDRSVREADEALAAAEAAALRAFEALLKERDVATKLASTIEAAEEGAPTELAMDGILREFGIARATSLREEPTWSDEEALRDARLYVGRSVVVKALNGDVSEGVIYKVRRVSDDIVYLVRYATGAKGILDAIAMLTCLTDADAMATVDDDEDEDGQDEQEYEEYEEEEEEDTTACAQKRKAPQMREAMRKARRAKNGLHFAASVVPSDLVASEPVDQLSLHGTKTRATVFATRNRSELPISKELFQFLTKGVNVERMEERQDVTLIYKQQALPACVKPHFGMYFHTDSLNIIRTGEGQRVTENTAYMFSRTVKPFHFVLEFVHS